MTAKANHSTQLRSCPSPLVLFGIDSHGNSVFHDVQESAKKKLEEIYARL